MKIDRALANAELNALADAGNLTPESVLAAAQSANNPMHDWFDWSDTEAAEKWRLQQARLLIKTVYVRITYATNTVVMVPAFVSEADDEDDETNTARHYSKVVEVMSDDDRRKALVIATIKRAASILRNCPEVICQRLADDLTAELAKL
jgi:hypothetical protein